MYVRSVLQCHLYVRVFTLMLAQKTEACGIIPLIYDKAELDATAYLHSYPTREPKNTSREEVDPTSKSYPSSKPNHWGIAVIQVCNSKR